MTTVATKYTIPLTPSNQSYFRNFVPSLGSGLEFIGFKDTGEMRFLAITDRGPNAQHKLYADSIVYFVPNYAVTIVKIVVDTTRNISYIEELMPIKKGAQGVSGINPNYYVHDETTYLPNQKQIQVDFGLDTEAISLTKNGDIVVSEEFFPSIVTINPNSGQIQKVYIPKGSFTVTKDSSLVVEALPEILQKRNCNRGFESVTVTPNGKVYSILEGALALDEATSHAAKFFRMVELDLETNAVRTFAYPYNHTLYPDALSAKVGDMAAIDDFNFLVVEQGKAFDGKFYNLIYKINIEDATDITNLNVSSDEELEHLSLESLSELVTFVNKSLLINPRDYGWREKKLEGLAIINSTTLALTYDNDFGVDGYNNTPLNQLASSEIIHSPTFESEVRNEIWILNSSEPLF